MIDRIPHVSEQGDSKYTILRDYDHIIASLDVAIDNIVKSQTLISERNSLSLSNLRMMRGLHDENLLKLINMRDQYVEDRNDLSNKLKLQS